MTNETKGAQAPTPGPLTAETVGLIRAGDVIAHDGDIPKPIHYVHRPDLIPEQVYSKMTFIGRPDADGWMPWSGGENPVPGQRVQWRTRNNSERVMSVLSNNLDWTHECRRGFDPIIAFRLASTAPVEASGSERDIKGETFMGFRVAAWRYRQGDETHKLPHHYAEHWSTPGASAWGVQRLFTEDQLQQALNLRPQPSGETRGPGGYLVKDFADGWYWTPNAAIECATGSPVWSVQNARYETKAEALIRPAPVASGGQHSSGECVHDGYEVDTAGQPLRCAECGAILSTAPVAETAREGVGEALGCEFRKTATIRAVQWHKMGDHPAVVLKSAQNRYADEGVPWCPTLEGGHVVTPGDWIATGVQGEHWPIKPNVFAATYEAVVDDGSLSQPVSPLTAGLHPKTAHLVNAFAISLAHKLLSAERKYGYSDGWLTDDWEAKCKADLLEHVQKGDPLDVAAYAAFCWARNWSTTPPVPAQDDDKLRIAVEALEKIEKDYDEYSANGTEHDAGFEKGLAAAAYRAAEALAALKSEGK